MVETMFSFPLRIIFYLRIKQYILACLWLRVGAFDWLYSGTRILNSFIANLLYRNFWTSKCNIEVFYFKQISR